MNIKIEKINEENKEYFFKKSVEFYQSEAVLHDIPYEYHQNSVIEMMNSDLYIQGFVIKYDEINVGYAVLNKTFSREAGGIVIWIEELFVDVKYQGKGIGTYFFNWLEDNFKAKRYRLEVEKDNRDAISLYERIGYKNLDYSQYVKEMI